jgi:rRNA maturation endonuclease Nob1
MLFLLDASAILNDFGFEFKKSSSYLTTNLVFSELRDFRSRHLAENAIKKGKLKIMDPSPHFQNEVKSTANSLECKNLSKPDLSILALAMESKRKNKKFVLITDDHLLQFLCLHLKIPFETVIRGKTRKKPRKSKKSIKSRKRPNNPK